MVMMLAVSVPADRQAAQAVGGAELSEDQRHQVVPAAEQLVVGVARVAVDDRLKLPPVDGFQKLAEQARREAHAPSFF